MEISEQVLEAHRKATRRPDRRECPESEILAAFARGELEEERRGKVLDHLVACSECSLEVRVAREVDAHTQGLAGQDAGRELAGQETGAEAGTHVKPPAVPLRPRSRRAARRWLPVAAAVAVAVFGVVWQAGRTDLDAPPTVSVERSSSIETRPASGAELDAAPATLRWPAVPGAEGYRPELFDAAGRSLWQSPWLEATEVELPEEMAATLESGRYLWTVSVRGRVSRRELGPFGFSVR